MNQQTLKIYERARFAIKADGTKIPVKDSKFSFLLEPNEQDIKDGIPGDHANCMYCLCCRRMYGSELVWVTRNFAYVELKRRGKSELHRFVLKDPAKANIKDFDSEKDVAPDAVIFAAPTGSDTLDAQAKNNDKRRKAYISGEISTKKSTEPRNPVAKKVDKFSTLRARATGKFHFQAKG